MTIFNLPDLGEGLPDAEISKWYVKEGDYIKRDQPMVAMETAKAVVDVPSPVEGKIIRLHGQQGDVVQTGKPLVEYENLLDFVEKATAQNSTHSDNDKGTVAGKIEVGNVIVTEEAISSGQQGIKATPAVRAIAKSLRVDLAKVIPTGSNGTITADDVRKYNEQSPQSNDSSALSNKENTLAPLGAGYEKLKGTRRTMAQTMINANAQVVPVTLVDDANVTNWLGKEDITTRLVQAITQACMNEPSLNAWYDDKHAARLVHQNVNLGLAVDSEDGLFVAVIKDTQTKDAAQIRQAVDKIKHDVQNRLIKPEDLKGHTITLSNFGKYAGRYASPIIVPPTVAIVGVGALKDEVIVEDGQMKIAKILPISLSFDHRSITGGEATRFLGIILSELKKG